MTVEFDDNDRVKRIHTIVISTQHSEDVSLEQIKKDSIQYVIQPVIPENLLDEDTIYYVNPTGRFVIGGPQGDSGLTGRKIIVDTYGGTGRHGGGAFSGKDPTKIRQRLTDQPLTLQDGLQKTWWQQVLQKK